MLHRWSRRRWLTTGVLMVLAVLLALNVSGVVRYPGGPMRAENADGLLWLDIKPPDQGSSTVALPAAAGFTTSMVFVTTAFLQNAGPWDARLEALELIDATPGLDLVSARLVLTGYAGSIPGADSATAGAVAGRYPDTHLGALPQTVAAHSTPYQGNVILELRASTPGEYSYRAVRIRYRVGPFAFQADYGQGVRLCVGPLAPGQVCPGDAAQAEG